MVAGMALGPYDARVMGIQIIDEETEPLWASVLPAKYSPVLDAEVGPWLVVEGVCPHGLGWRQAWYASEEMLSDWPAVEAVVAGPQPLECGDH